MPERGVLREKDQIRRDIKILEMNRDDLLEWLLQNTPESQTCRVYCGKSHTLIGIDKTKEE